MIKQSLTNKPESSSILKYLRARKHTGDWKYMTHIISSYDTIREFQDVLDWDCITTEYNLTDDFIREYQDKLNWSLLCKYYPMDLSKGQIREFKDKVDWKVIAEEGELTHDFIREFQNELDWHLITKHQRTNRAFIREFKHKIDWSGITCMSIIGDLDFIREFRDYIIDWHAPVTLVVIDEVPHDIISEFEDKLPWDDISANQTLSERFIRKYQDKLDWEEIIQHQDISDEFVLEFKDRFVKFHHIYLNFPTFMIEDENPVYERMNRLGLNNFYPLKGSQAMENMEGGGKCMDINRELRKLMDLYHDKQQKLSKEIKDAEKDKDLEWELCSKEAYITMQFSIGKLFKTMKDLGLLDEDEIEIGGIKSYNPNNMQDRIPWSTDPFLDTANAIQRLVNEWTEHGKIIIAYDFDDTVYDYHNRGSKYNHVIELLQQAKAYGAYFIVFTSCNEEKYDFIQEYLTSNDIPYDTINENMPFIPFNGRKVYYNILLDDRAGLVSAYNTLNTALRLMQSK